MKEWLARAPLAFLVGLYGATWMAPFLAPYSAERQFRSHVYAAPTELHWIDAEGRWHLRPLIIGPSEPDSVELAAVEPVHRRRLCRPLGLVPGE